MLQRIIIVTILIVILDLYAFQSFRFVLRNQADSFQKVVGIIYWSISISSLIWLALSVSPLADGWPKMLKTIGTSMVFILIISKLIIIIFLLTDDIFRGLFWSLKKIFNSGGSNSSSGSNTISRSDFLVKGGLMLAMVPFVSLIYGMIKGAYDYQVHKVKIKVKDLPEPFHGFRIVQVSDIHTGSFLNAEPLHDAVDRINELNADVILFTGDLVNNRSDEVEIHREALGKMKAQHGVYSILGNHDYGDYVEWPSQQAKEDNLRRLINTHKELGWDLLLDEHRLIQKDGHHLTLIGVQNWSTHLRFPKYGDMKKATENIQYSAFNILMSHDPSHWKGEVLHHYPDIHLMLAGHTHGMQFGVELPFFKWSPVQYVYKEWAGIYNYGHRNLYVNRGLGFLGYPGRVGILPEITVIELSKA